MKRITMFEFTIILLALLTLGAGVAVADQTEEAAEAAQTLEREAPPVRNWALRFGFLAVDNKGGSAVTVEPGAVDVGIDGGGGFGATLERRVSPLVGIEFGFFSAGSDLDVSTRAGVHHASTQTDVLMMTPLTLGANFHFVKDGPVGFYAGPLVAYTRYSEFSVRTEAGGWWYEDGGSGSTVTVRSRGQSEFSWGARTGLDVYFTKNKRWMAQFQLTYLDATYTFEEKSEPGRTEVSLDPLIFGFGVGFQF